VTPPPAAAARASSHAIALRKLMEDMAHPASLWQNLAGAAGSATLVCQRNAVFPVR